MLAGVRVLAVVIAATMVGAVAAAPPAAAKASKKPPNPCRVLLPDDLEQIFSQPWRSGTRELGGACTFGRPVGTKYPDIAVSLIIEQKASPARAKRVFAQETAATEDIVDQTERVPALGDGAYLTTIIGAYVLSFRVGRYLVDLRTRRIDKPEVTYHDETIAAGDIVKARLLPPPKPQRKHGG
jgi:hypothetical protein